jgi:hypothetical protein
MAEAAKPAGRRWTARAEAADAPSPELAVIVGYAAARPDWSARSGNISKRPHCKATDKRQIVADANLKRCSVDGLDVRMNKHLARHLSKTDFRGDTLVSPRYSSQANGP